MGRPDAYYGVTACPTSVLIGPGGNVIETHRGCAHDLEERLEELLEESGSNK